VHAPTIEVFGDLTVTFGNGVKVDGSVGPLSVTKWRQQIGAAIVSEPAYQPGKEKQQEIDAAALEKANAAAAAAAEATRWKPEDIEWVRQHPGSAKGDWVEPSDDTAYATPVDPLTDQNPVDHLPCAIARVACAAVGQQLAPALCEHPELQALKDRLCDGTAIYTIDGTACAPEAVSPSDDELAAGVERALLLCLAVAHVVEGENPCDPNRGADRTELTAALTAKETECRSLVYVDPGAGGEDPCAVTLAEPTPGGAPPTPPVPVPEGDQTPPPGGRLP
jgi:N-acetylmuramoyl-L-alanine amidase